MADSFNSSRKRALEIGTDPNKLSNDDYNSAGGFPNGTPGQSGTYSDPADAAKPNTGAAPISPKNPVK